jgi:hypothetical protein
LVRRIRDEHAAALAGKSRAEEIQFFRHAGQAAREEARRWEAAHPSAARGS